MTRAEAIDNLVISFDKLYTKLQNFEESMRIQAECKSKTFERMLDILKDLQHDLQTPESPEEVPADIGQGGDIKGSIVDAIHDSKPNTVISYNVSRPIAMKIIVGLTYTLDRQVKVSANSSFVHSLATQKLRNIASENSYGVKRLRISGYELNGSELSCLPTVCENASMCWSFVIVDARFLKPPAKPPDGVILGKVDVRKEIELPQICDVQEVLTIVLFSNGVHKHYIRQIINEAVTWIKKRTRPTVANVGIVELVQKVLDPASKVVLSFLNFLVCQVMVKEQFRREHRAIKRTKYETAHDSRIGCFAMTLDEHLIAALGCMCTVVKRIGCSSTYLQHTARLLCINLNTRIVFSSSFSLSFNSFVIFAVQFVYIGFPVGVKFVSDISFRADNEHFMLAMQGFTEKIVSRMKSVVFVTQGGPLILSQIEIEYASLKWETKLLAAEKLAIASSGVAASGEFYMKMGTSVSVAENLILRSSIGEKQALLVVVRFLLEGEGVEERSFSDEVLVRCQHLEDEVGKIKSEAGVNHSTSKIAWDSKVDQEKELPIAVEQVVEGQKTIYFLGVKLKSFYILGDFILDSNKSLKICDEVSPLELTDSHSNWFYKPNSNSELSFPEADHSSVVDSTYYLVIGVYGCTANMDNIIKAQPLRDSNMDGYMPSKKTMKVNSTVLALEELRKRGGAYINDKSVKNLVMLLFEKDLVMWLFKTTLLILDSSLVDLAFLVCCITKYLMFSSPRPPEIVDLEDKVNFKEGEMIRTGIIGNIGDALVFRVTSLLHKKMCNLE